MSAAQLGRVLDVPEGTVHTRSRRAKALVEAARSDLDASDEQLHSMLADIEGWTPSTA